MPSIPKLWEWLHSHLINKGPGGKNRLYNLVFSKLPKCFRKWLPWKPKLETKNIILPFINIPGANEVRSGSDGQPGRGALGGRGRAPKPLISGECGGESPPTMIQCCWSCEASGQGFGRMDGYGSMALLKAGANVGGEGQGDHSQAAAGGRSP